MSNVTTAWPLIYYIIKDSSYYAEYKSYVAAFAEIHYNSTALEGVIDARAALIQTAVGVERSGYTYTSASKFTAAANALKTQLAARYAAALAFAY